MTLSYPFGETVTHLDGTVTGQDADGSDTYTFPVKAVYTNIPVAPRDGNGTSGNERDYNQTLVTVGLTIFVPDGVSVSAVDRFIVRDVTWEVDGDPQFYNSPFTGWRPGSAVSLTRWTG